MHYGPWGKFLKWILTYLCSTKYNEINICHLDVKKTTFPIKNGINNTNILYTSSYKRIPIYNCQQVKNFKSAFKYVCVELNKMKLTRLIKMCKNIFAIKMILI